MNKQTVTYLKHIAVIPGLLFSHLAYSAPPPSAAECDALLQITVTDMDFGSYIGGTTGSIVMDTTGAMTHTGVIPASGSIGVPITIDIVAPGKNCDKRNITFTMPTSITINNISGSPPTSITISNLVSDLPTNPFQVRNVNQINIGGTLNATTGDAEAPYSGPFSVTLTVQ